MLIVAILNSKSIENTNLLVITGSQFSSSQNRGVGNLGLWMSDGMPIGHIIISEKTCFKKYNLLQHLSDLFHSH